jgi:D-glycero-D-manno-heptose 1,7-bisphosphate phosphatase
VSIRQGVILVGGFGTRLGELTRTTPKPMIEVAGRPFVEHVIAHLARFGLDEIVLLAGYRGEAFMSAYADREMFGATTRVFVETEPMGTAGALRLIENRLEPVFLMANGDTFFDADLRPLMSYAARPGISALLLRRVEDASRYGRVRIDTAGRAVAFNEKSPDGGRDGALISAGCYVLDRASVLAAIDTKPCSIETQVIPSLLAAGTLYAVEGQGYFVDMGLPASLTAAREELPGARRRPAAFLDRDGVLNADAGYTHRIEDLRLIEGAAAAVRAINDAGYYAIVVSNQAGIARGYYGEAEARAFNRHLRQRLMAEGARLDAVYFCPHHPEGVVVRYTQVCDCRKPAAGLLQQAALDWPIDKARSFLVGDMPSDVAAAEAFGIRGYRFAGGSLLAIAQKALTASS